MNSEGWDDFNWWKRGLGGWPAVSHCRPEEDSLSERNDDGPDSEDKEDPANVAGIAPIHSSPDNVELLNSSHGVSDTPAARVSSSVHSRDPERESISGMNRGS